MTNSFDAGMHVPQKDVTQLHQLALSEEALINKLDTKHTGHVTLDQLNSASKDKHLSADERRTAEIMLRTQEDLRYQRLGYLPPFETDGGAMAGEAAAAAAIAGAGGSTKGSEKTSPGTPPAGSAEAPSPNGPGSPDNLPPHVYRPYAQVHKPGSEDHEKGDFIKLTDVQSFDASVSRLDMGRDMSSRGAGEISHDIMSKYATGDHGRALTPRDVWSAVDKLSSAKQLSATDKEELEVLKATQNQMREMWPAKEPADHHSAAYKAYINDLNRLPIREDDLTDNVHQVIDNFKDNMAVQETVILVRHPHGGIDTMSPSDRAQQERKAGAARPAAPEATPQTPS